MLLSLLLSLPPALFLTLLLRSCLLQALHGTIGPGTTVFPQVIGMAASFNRSAWTVVGSTASSELRAGVNTGICLEGAAQRCSGLSVFAPNANIYRDPRWVSPLARNLAPGLAPGLALLLVILLAGC